MLEPTWQRVWRDIEGFRQTPKSFWVVEVVGAAAFGAVGGMTGVWLTPTHATTSQQNLYPIVGTAIGFIAGFVLTFGLIYVWNLFRAPYQQRNDALQLAENIRNNLQTQLDQSQTQLDQIKNARPNMVLVKTENFPFPIRSVQTGAVMGTPWFARVQFANDPLSSLQAVEAHKVAGHIEIYSQDKQHLYFKMIGRWSETKEVAVGGQPIETEQIDIPANGRPYPMDIGLKYQEDAEFYGYNNESPRFAADWRDKQKQLAVGTYSIRVWLRGDNVDKDFWFNLVNKGRGEDVVLSVGEAKLC